MSRLKALATRQTSWTSWRYFNETFEGFLTKQAERLNSGAGILVVVRLNPKLLVLFQMLSFDRVYRLANSREEAIEQLRTFR